MDGLDVLVCGRCRSAFHVLDEFSSHSKSCRGDNPPLERMEVRTAEAVAMVLWTNSVRRVLNQAGVAVAERGLSVCDRCATCFEFRRRLSSIFQENLITGYAKSGIT